MRTELRLPTLLAMAMGAACHATPPLGTRHYELHGTVIAMDRDRGQLVVQHDSIPGFMSAMTMPYAVGNAQDLAFLETGDEVRAVVVDSGGDVRLDHIRVLRHPKLNAPKP
jgi:protein SCO1/2